MANPTIYQPLLQKLATVEALSEAEKDSIVALCRDVHGVPRNRNIITEGANPDRVHIILSGWAARYNELRDGSRRITAFLLPGDFCDIQTTTLVAMDHSILAVTDCEVAFVAPALIEEITASSAVLTRAFWRSTLIDEAILRQWLVNTGRRNSKDRLACLLCELHARMNLVGLVSDGHMKLPLTQEFMADALG
ncbi:MAG: Crp/Fnr family transcriptional regulator [Alphaproteobacteria bacterium]|nr:MAG: Crp/Fnr family transcriptional regulator [Alphaproteobacteria bacterium]